MKPKILFVQHANVMGGSVQSLAHQLKGLSNLQPQYEIELAISTKDSSIRDLYQHSVSRTHDLKLAFFHNTTAHKPRSWNVTNHLFSCVKILWSCFMLVRFLRKHNFDIVYFNSYVLAPYLLVCKFLGVRAILHVRESPVPTLFNLRNKIGNLLIRKYSLSTIFLSEFERDRWGFSKNSSVVHNFISMPDGPRCGLIKDDPFIILYMGGHSRIKGIKEFLIPFSRFIHSNRHSERDIKLVFLGGAISSKVNWYRAFLTRIAGLVGVRPYSAQVNRLISDMNISYAIDREKTVKSVIPFVKKASVVVFPATKHHFPRPVVEASAFSVPVIVSNLEGYAELVKHGETGFLSEICDFDKYLQILFDDPVSAHKIGIANYNFAKKRFDLETNVSRIHELICEVL